MTTIDPFSPEADRIIAEGLSANERLGAMIATIKQARDTQPARLAEMRAQADQARAATLDAEPWLDTIKALPMTDANTGELTGMMSIPTIDGKEIWGARLAFDMADTGGDDKRVNEVLGRYFTALHGNTEHLFFVFSAALITLAKDLLPIMVDKLEQQGSDYDSRVILADAARNAWATRINDSEADQ